MNEASSGCLIFISIVILLTMLFSYGLGGTLAILLGLGVVALLILGIIAYSSSKYDEAKKRNDNLKRQEEQRIREQQNQEKLRIHEEEVRKLQMQRMEEELKDNLIKQEEQRIREQQRQEEERELRLHTLEEEKQLLSLLEQYGGPVITNTARSYLDSSEMSGQGIEIGRNRIDVIENYLILTLADNSIRKYANVLLRKKRQNIYTDDYGRRLIDRWSNELVYFVKNVFLKDLISQCNKIQDYSITESILFKEKVYYASDTSTEYWCNYIDEYLEKLKDDVKDEYESNLSGHEYENFVAGLIKSTGWNAQVTQKSGDHGADIIAETSDIRIAVQCKKYESSVGNKSVQEVFSAAQFYDCIFGCVVSNADFTPAARQAAAKLEVPLLHHDEVVNYFTAVKNACAENIQNSNTDVPILNKFEINEEES